MKKLILLLILPVLALAQPTPQPIFARISGEGSHKLLTPFNVDSGQTIHFLSGSTLTIDAGATFNFGSISLLWSGLTSIPSPTFTHTGDVTGNVTLLASGTATGALTLATVNSNVGTFAGLTVNGKGLVTGATALTTLAGYGITDPVVLTSGSYANPAWITSLAWAKLTGTPTTLAGYAITDPIALTSGSYANPAWITSLAGSKLTGAYTAAGLTVATGAVVLGRSAGSGAAQELGASAVLDFLGATRGSILFRGSSGWTILPPQTAGNVLTTNGAGNDPTWNTGGGGGGGTWGSITGLLSNQGDLQTALNGKQAVGNYITALTGDVTASGPGSAVVAVANIPAGVTLGGSLLATNIAAPGTPATGLSRFYFDSTSKNIAAKNDAGIINHGVQSRSGVTSNWIRSIADDGSVATSQPDFTNLTGSLAAGQMLALTGEVTNTAATTATTLSRSIAPTMTGQWTFNLLPNHVWTAGTAGVTFVPGNGGSIKVSPFTSNTNLTLPSSPADGYCFALSLNLCNGSSTLTASSGFYRVGVADASITVVTPSAGDQLMFFEYIGGKWMERDSFTGLPVLAANGGTGLDTSASTGFPSISGGTWSVKTVAQMNQAIIPAASALTETSNATTINAALSNSFTLTLNGNLNTVTLSNFVDGQTIIVTLTNTASNYTVTWGNSIKWPGGSQPVETVGAFSDVWTLTKQGSTIYGNAVQNF